MSAQVVTKEIDISGIDGLVLVVIDLQKNGLQQDSERGIPLMGGFAEVADKSSALLDVARSLNIPIVFTMEEHRDDLLDIGRELDGSEAIHCLQSDPMTEIADELGRRPNEALVRKRRYSIFFGTDLQIILRGHRAKSLILLGALTDVCVHYSFVDAHQNDYRTFVVEDCVIGSSEEAHSAALAAMEYLQSGAVVTSEEVIREIFRVQKVG